MEKSKVFQTGSIIMTGLGALFGVAATIFGNKEREEKDRVYEETRYRAIDEFRQEGRNAIAAFQKEGQAAISDYRNRFPIKEYRD